MTTRAAAPRRLLHGPRAVVAASTASFGALVAHHLGGGHVELVPGLVVAAVTLPLALVLLGRAERPAALGVVRLAVVAGAAQAVGHVALMLAPGAGGGHEHHGLAGAAAPQPTMVDHHLAVALATVAVACGFDRALVAIVRALAARLLPVVRDTGPVPALPVLAVRPRRVVRRPRLAIAAGGSRAPPLRRSAWTGPLPPAVA